MRYNNISLPYPVLGINDDVYPLLTEDCVTMDIPQKTPTDYIFSIHLSQNNKKITELIQQSKAEYACEITCKDTYLRKCIHSSEPVFKVKLSRKDVNGRINFSSFIAAKENIVGYTNEDFHEDYNGFSFDIEKGEMLAVFPLAYYNTNIKFDRLFAAGSFMQIVEAAEGVEKTWFNLDEERIMIEMPHQLFEQYKKIGNNFPEVIHSSIVHNALVYALSNLSQYQEKGKLWADSIMARMNEPALQQYDLSDMMQIFEVADILLQNPYKRLLDSLENINETINND